ncbi:metal ABC transporter solute-binding protein, Zn/Mn family [Klenkia taihuensis]|uniref:Zinc/manganese transport system substrate-binding protein n=1 Tax=Klenkia taihuensis TaxID=1225127 RepID=A0A1I1IB03_9ACTN|nr:zinc ABC transporter substrate-binding protein [Klenkia taihuensis]SFC32972.1 zinc/manganese transport system substrate-binding protein [Klenkia taihuensis]
MPRRPIVLAALAVSALGLAACGGGGDQNQTLTNQADAANCPADVLDVVVSVNQWGDIVQQLAGDCANVTTVINSTALDPHDYEPTTGDIAAFEDADLVVVNGADYDHWASDAVANLDPAPAVVDAAEVVGVEGGHSEEEGHSDEEAHSEEEGHSEEVHGSVNPHLWYSPEYVQETARAITAELSQLAPDAADYFTEQAQAFTEALQPYDEELTTLQGLATGKTYAATETVFDYTATAVGLTDATPEGYRDAASNESDPSPSDVAAFEAALADGSIDVLVYNTQTEGSVPEQLRAAAESAGVPVVDVTESVPDGDDSFVAWQLGQLQQLADALGGGQ